MLRQAPRQEPAGNWPRPRTGSISSQPIGAPFMIMLMPIPSIMPPTSEPMTPAERQAR